jgi:hypothetical protein
VLSAAPRSVPLASTLRALVDYLLPSMRHAVLRHLAAAGDAHPDVARAAASLLSLRGAGPSPGA